MPNSDFLSAPDQDLLATQIAQRLQDHQVDWDRTQENINHAPPSDEDSAAWVEQEINVELEALTQDRTRQGLAGLSLEAEDALVHAIRLKLNPIKVILDLLDSPTVEEITINDHMTTWITEAGGKKHRGPPMAASGEALETMIRWCATNLGRTERRFDSSAPFLNLTLPDGSRMNAVMAVTAETTVTIRKHRYIEVSLDDLVAKGTLDRGLRDFLSDAITGDLPANILVAGGTTAGKTTFLRALAAEIDPSHRLITIEDTLELMLSQDAARGDIVEMETRPANIEGKGEITQQDLVRNARRMRPDRLIVGEVRGSEVVDMLNAMIGGNEGSLSTIHSDTARTAINMMAIYGEQAGLDQNALFALVAGAIHIIVHLRHLPSGDRVVSQVLEILGDRTDSGGVATSELWATGRDGRATRTQTQPGARLAARLSGGGFGGEW